MKPIQLITFPILGGLTIWAAVSSPWKVKQNLPSLDKKLRNQTIVKSKKAEKDELVDFLSENRVLTRSDADKQWQRTLFNSMRKEEKIVDATKQGVKGQTKVGQYKMELIGAGRYGKKAYAAITVNKGSSRSSYRSSSSRYRSSSRTSSRTTSSLKKPSSTYSREGKSNVVHKGEMVGDTGYKLTEIHFVPRSKKESDGSTYVVLIKGSERIELHLDKGGKSSTARINKDLASRKVEETKPPVEEIKPKETKKPTLTPPPPPPPPPIASGLPGSFSPGSPGAKGSADTRRETPINVLDKKALDALRKNRNR